MKDAMLPRYMRVAHWLEREQRPVSAKEAAEVFQISPWAMGEEFTRIKRLHLIVVVEESKVRRHGGIVALLRVRYIYPYDLDAQNKPFRCSAGYNSHEAPLTWRDLLMRPWPKLVERYRLSQ